MEQGFVVYPTYEMDGNSATVQLYGRFENGETFRLDFPTKPYFFIRAVDLERAKQIVSLNTEETDLKNFSDEEVVKVVMDIPKDVPGVRKQLEDQGIPCYEADIRFSYRFLIDNGITSDIAVNGEYEKGAGVDRVYTNPKIESGKWTGELTVLSIDIETDEKAKELWAVSIATKDRTEKMIVGREVKDGLSFATEKELLIKLNELIAEIDPDIITGWNVIGFDFKVLNEKYEQHKVPWSWARCNRKVKLRIESDFFRDSKAEIPGRMVLDGIDMLKNNFVSLEDYKLDTAAKEFVGDSKIIEGDDKVEQIIDAYNNDPQKLLDYNLKDAELVLQILDNSNTLKLTITRSLLTGMQLDRVRASIASLDNVYLPRLRKRGYVAPSSGFVDRREQTTGGYVMSGKPGIYDYVIVCDFKSLYPSIMRTLNIGPLAFKQGMKLESSNEKYNLAENGAVFDKELGILPAVIEEIWQEREKARKEKDELARYALKILMNSFYGVLASPNCRFYSFEMANAITHTGHHLIKLTASKMEEKGYEVIYGDTDSIFVDLKVSSLEEAERIGNEIEKDVNAFMVKYIEDRYKTKSYLELEFEKTFVRFLMPRTRSGEGSKKRYAGKRENDKIEFTGMEFVRRDWTELAKTFQLTILDYIFEKKDPQEYIKKFVEDLKAGKHDDLLLYKKALRKSEDQYTKTTPPHVKAARLLPKITSRVIKYYMTVSGPEPEGFVKHSLDYDHYIEKQLRPIADGILGFYNTTFEDVLKGTKQQTLF